MKKSGRIPWKNAAIIKKKADEEKRLLLYVDESGFYLSVKISATWAKKGQTPSIKEGCRYQHLSAISAISPDGKLYYQIQEATYKEIDIVDFLKNLLTFFDKDLLIIWDGEKIHSDENVRKFLENDNNNRIFLAKIPPYSPELNADEHGNT